MISTAHDRLLVNAATMIDTRKIVVNGTQVSELHVLFEEAIAAARQRIKRVLRSCDRENKHTRTHTVSYQKKNTRRQYNKIKRKGQKNKYTQLYSGTNKCIEYRIE